MAEFTLDLSDVVDELTVDIDVAIRRLSLDILVRLTQKTPVDTGRAKSNWIISINSPVSTTSKFRSKTSLGQPATAAVGRGNATLKTFDLKTDTSVYIQNNLPYIQKLNEGSSTQAPSGFVQMAMREASMAFDRNR